jgi:mannose-6-phosphate isomerase-like protein (cupin superfamily)
MAVRGDMSSEQVSPDQVSPDGVDRRLVDDPTSQVVHEERPWGGFEQLAHNVTCTVKIIRVDPGHRLSLQRHSHRGEFWTVLDEPMTIEVDEHTWVAQPGEKVWVPQGSTHRMSNRGERPTRILEIAFGDFDEADIERLEDDYARQMVPPTNPDRHYAAPPGHVD